MMIFKSLQREESLKHLIEEAVSVDASDAQKEKFKSQPNRFRRATFDLTYRVNVPGATRLPIKFPQVL